MPAGRKKASPIKSNVLLTSLLEEGTSEICSNNGGNNLTSMCMGSRRKVIILSIEGHHEMYSEWTSISKEGFPMIGSAFPMTLV